MGLHAAIEFHLLTQPDLKTILAGFDKAELAEKLANVRCFKEGYHTSITGLTEMQLTETAIEHFFGVPFLLQRDIPELYAAIAEKLHQNPLNETYPVLK